jgi:hypothetical protein
MTWNDLRKQAREIKRRKTAQGQKRQAQKYFEMVREILRPAKPEGEAK